MILCFLDTIWISTSTSLLNHFYWRTEDWRNLVWAQNSQTVLHLHCGEDPDRLHHRLVREQHHSQLESPEENSSDGPSTSLEVSFPPSRTSTPSDVRGNHGRSSETLASQAMNSSRCYHQADGTAASGPEPTEHETASSRRPSDYWAPDSKLHSPTQPPIHTSHWISSTHQPHWLWQQCSMSPTA